LLLDEAPVDDLPNVLQILGSAILVVQVVRMFPYINLHHDSVGRSVNTNVQVVVVVMVVMDIRREWHEQEHGPQDDLGWEWR
jgi:hypothetical protein